MPRTLAAIDADLTRWSVVRRVARTKGTDADRAEADRRVEALLDERSTAAARAAAARGRDVPDDAA